jgi:hypothetical protein
MCAIRVDSPLSAAATHGARIQAGGARGCYFFRITTEPTRQAEVRHTSGPVGAYDLRRAR